ncbi:MAG: aminotransferase class V-fold PLP-dependent enzyme [Lentisphaerae bacterium]|nr:aminotransferase class V-fold PLP-dependent enzyme [Lentisphaerota bacterium]
MIYLDHAAASPILPDIAAEHAARCACYAVNPHASGRSSEPAKRALLLAERDLLEGLGIPTEQARVLWTASGTEANNLATLGVLRRRDGALALVDAGAHPSLAEPCRYHARREGGAIADLPLDPDGALALARVPRQAVAAAALVAVTHVNNETGAIADLVGLRDGLRAQAAPATLLVDAAQSFGKVAIPWAAAEIDLLTLSARKIGGPAAVAALVVRRGTVLEPVLHGGGQQHGLRPGTVDVVGVIEAAQAARVALAEQADEARRVGVLNHALRHGLAQWAPPQPVILSPPQASPWILAFAIPGREGAVVMRLLAERDIVIGTGSACSAESGRTSHVLKAMGVPTALARSALRVSFGRDSTMAHVEALLQALRGVVDAY